MRTSVSVPNVLIKIQKLEHPFLEFDSGQTVYIYINGRVCCDDKVVDLHREISQRDIELWFGTKFRD